MDREEEGLIDDFQSEVLQQIKKRCIIVYTKSNQPTLGLPQVDLERLVFHVLFPQFRQLLDKIKNLPQNTPSRRK